MTVLPHERDRGGRPKTLARAIQDGDYLEILQAQRREILSAMPDTTGVALAALHRQLTSLSREIDGLLVAAADAQAVVKHSDDAVWQPTAI